MTTVGNETGSRRGFLARLAGGSFALATLSPSELLGAAAPLLPRPLSAPDEAYWRQVKAQFPLKDGIVPFNAANLCPAPRIVVDAVGSAMRDVEGDVSFENRAKYDELRETVRRGLAAYLGASADEIAIVRNTSEANNIVVGGLSLKAGDEVVLFDQNHPTNAVAWEVRGARYGYTVKRVAVPPEVGSPAQVVEIFSRALGPRTRVLAFSDVSNSSGIQLPTRELCGLARRRGIYTHVDGAQTFGATVRDLYALGCDSYSASAHKWFMGPKEAGVLFVRAERIAELWPGVVGVGWGSTPETSARGARKFETLGQRNDATTAGLAAALRLHELIGPAVVQARVLELAGVLAERLRAVPGARVITPAHPELTSGVVITRFENADNRSIYQRLYREHGVAGAATGGVRLCPHVYTTLEDVERAAQAVARLAA